MPVGFWRSVGHSFNTFAVECAIDELAQLAGADPVDFRLAMLTGDPRAAAVLQKAAALAGWGGPVPAGRARGVALAAAFGSIVAQIAEVSSPAPGRIKVERVWCAIDCGQVVNPSIVEAQMQGGIVHGLTAALWGRMSFSNGVASPVNFNRYRMTRMRGHAPHRGGDHREHRGARGSGRARRPADRTGGRECLVPADGHACAVAAAAVTIRTGGADRTGAAAVRDRSGPDRARGSVAIEAR